jgi:threonine/homoserine/homoserine lactone efflux protein
VLNPFVPLFWIGVAASLAGKAYAPAATFQFYSTTLLVVFSTDLLKAAFARKLEPLMTPSRFRVLHRISGLGLVLFGLRLLFSA